MRFYGISQDEFLWRMSWQNNLAFMSIINNSEKSDKKDNDKDEYITVSRFGGGTKRVQKVDRL